MRSKSVVLAALAAAGALSLQPVLVQQQPAVQLVVPESKKRRRSLFSGAMYSYQQPYGRKGAGISVAQQKRTAKKARNVARNRAAHRN